MKCLQKFCCTLLVFIFGGGQIMANEVDLRISDDTIHGNYAATTDTTLFGLGYLYKNADSSINIINTDFHVRGQTAIGNLPMTVSMGFQGNFFKEEV